MLVSAVIPCFNAERTLGETLQSVQEQTHTCLEIIVVDDGSVDATREIAAEHAAADARVRVISLGENHGVAAARNAGIAASNGLYIAPIDADDLWHHAKISRQLKVIEADPDIGYVYTLHRRIDLEDRVLASGQDPTILSGSVYLRSILENFVGNGSSLLIRRAALLEIGGYERGLHERGLQGCEDYLLQVMIARRWKVGCVPEFLTGYRIQPGSMSSHAERMARSRLAALKHVALSFPDTPPAVLRAAECRVRMRMVRILLRHGLIRPALTELAEAIRLDVHLVRENLYSHMSSMTRRFLSKILFQSETGSTSKSFSEIDPMQPVHRSARRQSRRRRLAELASDDAERS